MNSKEEILETARIWYQEGFEDGKQSERKRILELIERAKTRIKNESYVLEEVIEMGRLWKVLEALKKEVGEE